MSVTFTFDLSQQQFELRCQERKRRLEQAELLELIADCERCYYTGRPRDAWGNLYDSPEQMVQLGRRLYDWLDGAEGWLRRVLNYGSGQMFVFDLIQARETQALNQDTEAIRLRLAIYPGSCCMMGASFCSSSSNC
jgi:hypothetical protein